MMINCPECQKMISDKAQFCPNCGYPINSMPIPQNALNEANTRSQRRKMKLPNGYGSISKISGARRRPYVAYMPVKEWTDQGNPIRKPIGYYATYKEALEGLTAYHKDGAVSTGATFAEVYSEWYKFKYGDDLTHFSTSSEKNMRWAYNQCSSLYERKMSQIVAKDMQELVDKQANKSRSSVTNLLTLFHQMCRYAFENGIVARDYSQFVRIKAHATTRKGIPFTEDEVALLWQHSSNENVQIALILIYTGLRISELKAVSIDKANKVLRGGLKTENGRNRTVPIHSAIMPFVEHFDQAKYSPDYWRDKYWKPMLEAVGITRSELVPHSCRHTFSYLCDKYSVDPLSKHLMMGHSLGKDTEINTYGHRTIEDLRNEIEKIELSSTCRQRVVNRVEF